MLRPTEGPIPIPRLSFRHVVVSAAVGAHRDCLHHRDGTDLTGTASFLVGLDVDRRFRRCQMVG